MNKTFCDNCGVEIGVHDRNVVKKKYKPQQRSAEYVTVVLEVTIEGCDDLCLDCLRKLVEEESKKEESTDDQDLLRSM